MMHFYLLALVLSPFIFITITSLVAYHKALKSDFDTNNNYDLMQPKKFLEDSLNAACYYAVSEPMKFLLDWGTIFYFYVSLYVSAPKVFVNFEIDKYVGFYSAFVLLSFFINMILIWKSRGKAVEKNITTAAA